MRIDRPVAVRRYGTGPRLPARWNARAVRVGYPDLPGRDGVQVAARRVSIVRAAEPGRGHRRAERRPRERRPSKALRLVLASATDTLLPAATVRRAARESRGRLRS